MMGANLCGKTQQEREEMSQENNDGGIGGCILVLILIAIFAPGLFGGIVAFAGQAMPAIGVLMVIGFLIAIFSSSK